MIQGGAEFMSAGEKQKAAKILYDARAKLGGIPLPGLEKAQAILVQSDAGQVRSDPSLQAAQRTAYDQLQGVIDEGGYDLGERTAQAQLEGGLARHESAGRHAIANNAQATGNGGSGAMLGMQMMGNQASAERAADSGAARAARAKKSVLDAMMGRGEMAGKMRSQDYGEKSDAARARDSMKIFNAGAQARADAYNRGIPQQNYENQMRQAGAEMGMDSALAGMHNNNAEDMRNAGAGYGKAAYEGVKAYATDDDYVYDKNGNKRS